MSALAQEAARELEPGLWLRGARPRLSDFSLAVFDMDSTLIQIECIDEIAALAGKGAEVAAITEAAMRGEIPDFRASLQQRLALLAGQPAELLQRVLDERLRLMPGAQALCTGLKAAGLRLALVSGGFGFFAEVVAARLGLDAVRANALEVVNGRLTGRVTMQAWGDVVDAEEKARFLAEQCALLGVPSTRALAVGDGANDLRMMAASGLGVAYRAKPRVRAQAQVAIDEGGLERLLTVFAVGVG